ncbi:hypothetical protein [Brevundimonas diminuta]|uniref:hypothetical protein n=1 Tax=Brevundimonas diminuta TaxID=293 RepID=UPI003F7EC78C
MQLDFRMTEKLDVTAEDVSVAAFQGWMALTAELTRKGVLSNDDANAVAATAASMCMAQGSKNAAELIHTSIPTSRNVDPVARALDVGMKVERKPE